MSSQAVVRRQLASAASLGNVVKTMKSLASVRVHQYRRTMRALDASTLTLDRAARALLILHPELADAMPVTPEASITVVFGSERGLCGPFNERMARFADRRMRWSERLSRPRLQGLASGIGERFAAGFMILATATIVLPMTNTVPSVALALLAVGIIQRDGLFVALGTMVAVGWVSALVAVATGLALGAGWAVELLPRFG